MFTKYIWRLFLLFQLFSLTVLGKDIVITPKIINGTVAKAEENKYQVSIHLKELDWYFGSGHICGGALISPSIVITAAHCVYNKDLQVIRTTNEFLISMGSLDRFDRINSTTFEVHDIFYKTTFNATTYVDDLAVFILNGRVPEKFKHIQPIEMNLNATILTGEMCQVSGWGLTQHGFTSDVLMVVSLPIVNQTVCETNYNGSVSEGMICAGYMNGTADSCDGDSGGPLVCHGKLTGIVSFGVGCGVVDFPGVYTDLRYHSKWIQNITERYGNVGNMVSAKMSLLTFTFSIVILFFLTIKK